MSLSFIIISYVKGRRIITKTYLSYYNQFSRVTIISAGHNDPTVPPHEEILLNQVEDRNVQEIVDTRTTEGGRPTATPTDNGNSEMYRDPATSNQCEYQKDNSYTSTREQFHNNNSVFRSSKSPHVESVTSNCEFIEVNCYHFEGLILENCVRI